MVKNWLVLGSVAFGVGFSLSLPITRNLKDSALIGLVTLPAATAGAFVVSRQQKRGMGLAISSLQTEIQSLEQQKDALKQSVKAFRDRQKAADEKFSGLEAQREQAHTQLSTLEQQKQVIQQELVALEEQRQSLQPIFSSLQTEIESLEQQKQTLDQSINSIRSQRQPVEQELEQLKTQKAQVKIQLETEEQQRQTTQQELTALEEQKQSLTEEAYYLEARLQELKVQETQLSTSLAALTAQQNQLDDQLGTREQERQVSQQELVVLEAHKQALSKEALALESRLEGLRAQEHELLRLLTQQSEQKQTIEIDLTRLRGHLQTDQQHKLNLTQELEHLSSQRSELTDCLHQLHEQIRAAQIQSSQQTIIRKDSLTALSEPPTVNIRSSPIEADTSESSSDALTVANLAQETLAMVIDQRSQPIELPGQEEFEAPDTATDFRLANPEHTRWLWEGVVVPRWQYPRFLGSVCLPRYDTGDVWGTETILDLVGDNLRRVGTNYLEYNRLYDRFGDEEHLNWLKILTFAMSEHAYYMEAEGGFWKGLCERLGLPYQDDSHEPISTLKELAAEGINFLKLPKAVGGYPIVSTLWLQSGIPYRNLNHFADLVADLAGELGWNYLLNADAGLLAQKLLDNCQNSRYQGRTVLRRFLEYGCRPQTEPVSGKLLQSIAGVAIALQEYNLQPQDVLLNPSRRQEFLLNAVPQFNFFLRDWDALIQILTPRPNPNTRSTSGGQMPLALRLDVENLFIEIVLPEQTLRNDDWLAGTCLIHEAAWQGEIDSSGRIEIEESTQPIYQINEGWHWQLLDERGNCLRSWYLEGITSDFPCLVFDAWTGERLLPNPQLTDCQEIFCFAPIGTTIAFTGTIELTEESPVPCSIQGWQGRRLRLSGQGGTLNFQFGDSPFALDWSTATAEPRLRGLRLRGQNAPYLEIPTLWYPPHPNALALTLTVQERFVESHPLLIQETITVSGGNKWSAISLDQWLDRAGHYSVNLTAPEEEWSQKFEVQPPYQVNIDEINSFVPVQVTDSKGILINLPLTVAQSHQFWSTTLSMTGLWTLEPIKLLLSNGQSQTDRTVQANALGHLRLELSILHDLLPISKEYFLDYQRSGQAAQSLVQLVEALPLSWKWGDRNIEFTGLTADQAYKVNCWNLLIPQQPSIEIPISVEASTAISLDLPPGIYYLQLAALNQPVQDLGWWCGSDQYSLPVETEDDEALANYCYTILDDALINEFQTASSHLTWDQGWLETVTTSLEAGNYHFPDWLNAKALLAKLQSLSVPLHGQWYKICTAEGKRGDFRDALVDTIARNNLWHLILEFRRHRQRDERNIAFVCLADSETVRPYLSKIPSFEWVSRSPLSLQDAESLLENSDVE